ncbi:MULTISPECIES: hypothetical protein [unclassified Sedimentibacter]|uniref:hypothetical protein n=1 Tax=unclassified Sedimentibacter TaxID=2649220 RepID=UPI0027E07C81|nr:hypothetical protein [Sedimentibacter sp. MB35-C1]WMJ76357.1 hypothetical protein RBQ61_12060 [Sedimentibacter sp. MB35-C1]
MNNRVIMKDEKLSYIIENNYGNIAQFISFGCNEEGMPRFVYINNYTYNNCTNKELIEKLINSSKSNSVNIRSYSPHVMKGNKLISNKKIENIEEILDILKNNRLEGKCSIINENIDINDGGISGVVLGNTIEFSPKDTPKCVDKEGVCRLPREIGYEILEKVYGFKPDVNFDPNYRIEFSVHPNRQGVNKEHTIIWEYEYYNEISNDSIITWPNNFSRFIGDKVFGLLIADILGLRVPRTTVISRNIAPFIFGKETGLYEKWIRTCPIIKEPGKYYTGDSWIDPFKLMNLEEVKGDNDVNIASILSQEAVKPIFSGGSIIKKNRIDDIIEGVMGKGDSFMVGSESTQKLPKEVINEVKKLNNKIRSYHNYLGEVSIEWVYDGKDVWVVQLNQLRVSGNNHTIVKGNPEYYQEFYVKNGLDALRKVIVNLGDKNIGIELIGDVGITSHFGDLLRQSNIPSKVRYM